MSQTLDMPTLAEKQRAYFFKQETKSYAFRREKLEALGRWMDAHEGEILAALQSDLGKCPYEGYLTEVGMVREELRDALRHLKRDMRPLHARAAVGQLPGRCRIYREPYGTVLILSPWNYPFQLTVAPLIGALAAGNCAVVKPSAYSVATSALVARMLGELYAPEYVACVEGGRKENAALLEQHFDYIFFTGSPTVGKLVMEKASRFLTPVSLELGGKSPVIVDTSADITLTAKRLAWGKYLNAGQTCVAPDYALVPQGMEQALVEALIAAVRSLYGDAPLANPELPKIINEKHFERLTGLLGSGCVSLGGQCDPATRKLAPTILTDVEWDSPVMQEEVFGPILPILTYRTLDEAVRHIQSRPKPLALYLFTRDKTVESRVMEQVSFGGGCVNDTILHLATTHMPFGGVGESGMGNYHGAWSFRTFSHEKSVLHRGAKPDVALRYAPYGDRLKTLKKLI